jgi:integrase
MGAQMRFTDLMLKKLQATKKKYYLREGSGFTIRVLPSGVKTWLYIFTYDGKRHEMNLGLYPAVSLEAARQKYNEARRALLNGKNPAAAERERIEDRRKAPTVKDLCGEYIERHAKRFKRSWEKDERMLNHDIVPAWGKRKAADITKTDVVHLLEEIVVDRGAPVMANNTFAVIRKMFNFAVERDILKYSPCIGVKSPAPSNARDRVLSETEIKTFWHKLDKAAMFPESKNALRLILITAQRPGEVIGMHTSEIDGEWWTIPPERTKNKKAHRVYLSDMAREIIKQSVNYIKLIREIPTGREYNGFIFPSPRHGNSKPIAPLALSIAVSRNLAAPVLDKNKKVIKTINKLGVDQFTPHDLRRTAATFMAEAGETDSVIDAILNHAKQGIIKVYNQYRYDREKQAALESWARRLNSITTGSKADNVVPMRRKTG